MLLLLVVVGMLLVLSTLLLFTEQYVQHDDTRVRSSTRSLAHRLEVVLRITFNPIPLTVWVSQTCPGVTTRLSFRPQPSGKRRGRRDGSG